MALHDTSRPRFLPELSALPKLPTRRSAGSCYTHPRPPAGEVVQSGGIFWIQKRKSSRTSRRWDKGEAIPEESPCPKATGSASCEKPLPAQRGCVLEIGAGAALLYSPGTGGTPTAPQRHQRLVPRGPRRCPLGSAQLRGSHGSAAAKCACAWPAAPPRQAASRT